MKKIFFIDPQSYNNLSIYDSGVLRRVPKDLVCFFGSQNWDITPLSNAKMYLVFKYNNVHNVFLKGLSYAISLIKIGAIINRYSPKLVHIQWIREFKIDFLFLKYLQARGIKVIYTAHNILPHDSGNKKFSQYKRYYNQVNNIIVHSENTKKELIKTFNLSENKIQVIPHGIISINEEQININNRMAELADRYGLRNKLIFSSLGIQSKYKGIDDLIKVWSETPALKDNKEIKLVLVGKNQGIDYSCLKSIDNVVVIDRKVSNLDFLSWIKLSSVVLLPYKKISQSGLLFSALGNNKPVVVSNVGGLPEPLKIGNVGWNMGKPTEPNLKEILLRLINTNEISLISTNLLDFEKIKDYYSWDKISSQTLKLYNSILNE